MRRTTPKVLQSMPLKALMIGLVAAVASLAACIGEGSQEKIGSKTRTYYIAADPVDWDYAPKGISEISGKPFNDDENVFVGQGKHRIGKTYRKALYREYTDDSFSELKKRPKDQDYLGTLGPLMEAEVGDTIKVHFKNNTNFPASMHPHGVFYKKNSEGAPTRTAPQVRRTRATMWSSRERSTPTPGRSQRGRAQDPRTRVR
jgi:FtsP/CotA-like multicopper oxidase with cupredoxin domain